MNASRIRRTAIVCMAVLGWLTAEASGATLRVTSGSSYTMTGRQTLTMEPGGLSIACDHSFGIALSTTSIVGALPLVSPIGSVSRGSTGNCSGGQLFNHLGLPWALSLVNSTGRADGTQLRIHNMQFERTIGAAACLYAGDVTGTVGSSGTVLSLNVSVPLVRGGFICPDPHRMAGTLALSPALTVVLTP